MRPSAGVKGLLLRWINGSDGVPWGNDPGAFDPAAVTETLERIGRLFGPGRYFGLDVKGWAEIPEPPVMIVSNHSGGTVIPDAWGFLCAWYRHFGVGRRLHPLAHEMVVANRWTGPWFAKRGVLAASPGAGAEVLQRWRRDLIVMPGGDLDTWRPYSQRYQVRFAGRTGYARLALRAGVPIVPLANAGAHETLIVLSDGRRFARAIGLPAIARAEIFPIHLSLPWGLAIGPWPHLPPPTKLRYRIGPAIMPAIPVRAGEEPSGEAVRALDADVREAVQRLLDQLAADVSDPVAASAPR